MKFLILIVSMNKSFLDLIQLKIALGNVLFVHFDAILITEVPQIFLKPLSTNIKKCLESFPVYLKNNLPSFLTLQI